MAIRAVSAMGYSGRFSETMTTRSPDATPAVRRWRAQEAAMRPNSPQVVDCHVPSRNALSIGLSGQDRASANIIAGRLGQVGYSSTSPPLSGLRRTQTFDLCPHYLTWITTVAS